MNYYCQTIKLFTKYIYRFIIVKNKNSYTNKASKINTGNNPLLFFGLSGISVVFPVIRVFPVNLGTPGLLTNCVILTLGYELALWSVSKFKAIKYKQNDW